MTTIDSRLEEFKADNLSSECIFTNAVQIERSTYYIVMPTITNDILEQYYAGYLDNMPKDLDGFDYIEEYAENQADAFEQSDSYFDWEQDCEPHTTWFYLIPLTNKTVNELETIATNIANWSGNVTLLECEGEYYLTFSASGMNLSWDMAIAFIACGFIPPFEILQNLPSCSSAGKYKSDLGDIESSLVLSSVLNCAIHLSLQADNLTASLETLTTDKGKKTCINL